MAKHSYQVINVYRQNTDGAGLLKASEVYRKEGKFRGYFFAPAPGRGARALGHTRKNKPISI